MSKAMHPRTRRSARGFTLVEILMVIAIIGILASVAVPAYQRYVYRAEAAELVLKMDRLRGVLTELEASTGKRVGSELRVWTRAAVLQATNSTGGVLGANIDARADQRTLLWCPLPAGGVSCVSVDQGAVLSGLTGTDLDAPHLGIRLTVSTSGRPAAGPRDGLFTVVVEFPRNNPHGTQVGLAFVDLMRPYANNVSLGSQAAVLHMRIGPAKS